MHTHLLPRVPTPAALLLVLLLVPAAPTAAAELTATERSLAATIADRRDQAMELLIETVNRNSGTLHLEGVREVGSMFRIELEELGFDTRWVDMAEVDRAGHLVAHRPARTRDPVKVLFIGHLDTVFEPESPFQEFQYVTEDGEPSTEPTRWGKGPGTIDMKGGNVVMLEVVRALGSVGALENIDITLVLIGDEERAGRPLSISRRDLREAADGADFALGFEDGDGDPSTAVISRRGAARWSLEVTGTPAHSSQVFQPEYGAGAILEASRILHRFYRELSDVPNLTFNPGTILGGTEVSFDQGTASGTAFGKNNVIAERAVVHGDLRALSPQQYEEARERMIAIVRENLPRTSAEITFDPGYPPMAPTDGNRELLSMVDRASRDLGLGPVEPVDPRNAGAADISFVAGLVPAALDGLGLMGKGGHTLGETADLDTLVTQAQRVALVLYRLAER